jgi:hypothetical protein
MATLLDSNPTINQNDNDVIESASYTKAGNSFTSSANASLYSCKFNLKKSGSPTGNATAYLYAHTGVYGTSSLPGTLLATSNTFDVSTLTTSYQLIEFLFPGGQQPVLVAGMHYCIEFDYPGGDVSNQVIIGLETPGTASGNSFHYFSGSYSAFGSDYIFEVYGVVINNSNMFLLF